MFALTFKASIFLVSREVERRLMLMNPLKRAIISIRRTPLKVLLLFSLVLIMGTVVVGAILMNSAIDHTIDHLGQRLPTIMTIEVDTEALRERGISTDEMMYGETVHLFEHLTSERVREIGDLPYVRYFDYSIIAGAWSADLNRYIPEAMFDISDVLGETERNQIRLDGISRTEPLQMSNGLFELIKGRVFTNEEITPLERPDIAPVLISSSVAQMNNLEIGSLFNLYEDQFQLTESENIPEGGFIVSELEDLWEHPYNISKVVSYAFEVIGIFDIEQVPAMDTEGFFMQLLLYNAFLTPNWRTEEIAQDVMTSERDFVSVFNIGVEAALIGWDEITVTPYWILEDWQYAEDFKLAAEALLPELWLIEDLTSTLSRVSLSMGILTGIANQALWFAVGAMLLVLSLLAMLYLHDRRHEMGIYLALGEKKLKVIFQMLFEVGTIALTGLIVAMFVGRLAAPRISYEMLKNELAQGQVAWGEIPSALEFGGFGRVPTIDETLGVFTISLSPQVVVMFYGIGFLTITLSTIVPVVYILEINPKDILMKAKIE